MLRNYKLERELKVALAALAQQKKWINSLRALLFFSLLALILAVFS